MNSTRCTLYALCLALFSFGSTVGQQRTPATNQSPVPIVTVTASQERVRYIAAGEVHQTRLQVFSVDGTQVFDSGLRLGNLIDWQLQDQQGQALSADSYLYLITVKDFSERLTQKYGTAVLDEGQVYLEQHNRNELPLLQANALEAHRQSDSLSAVDRIGVSAVSSSSTIASTPTSTTGTEPSATDNVSATPTVESNATGSGSQNYLARWTDNAGTLGNSTLFQNAGRIGLDTVTPGAKFHVVGTQGVIGAGAFQLDTPITFGSWSGAYPAFEIVNTNLTNNNVSLFSFSDAPSGASHAGIGAVNTSHGNKWGHLFFYSKQSDGYQVRMGIYNGGYVGIGTTTPSQRLSVNGNIQILGAANGIVFPDGSIQTKAVAGTINGTGITNRIAKFTGPNSFGNSSITEVAGNVGIGTASPGKRLTIAGDAELGTSHGDYRHLRIGGGNSSGFLYGSFPHFADGIHLGYNYYADAAGSNQVIQPDGGTSRLSLGYGYIALATNGSFQSEPINRVTINSLGNVGIGTDSPQDRLEVRGNIRLGFSGQYRATSGEENLRIVRGIVSATGEILAGSGFTVDPYVFDSGVYTIRFTTPFAGTPAVTATATGSRHVMTNSDVTTSDFRLVATQLAPGGPNTFFHFIVIGPR